MFFNLLSLILIYLLFFSIVFASGSFANNFFLRFEKLTFGETGILGFVFIYTIILIYRFMKF